MADNVIRVNVTTVKPQSINVRQSSEQNYITASGDTSGYNAQLAKNWAIADGLVQGVDYSSKHYAKVAKGHANATANTLGVAQDIINNFDGNISNVLEVVSSAKDEAVAEIENSRDSVVSNVETAGATAIANIEALETETATAISDLKNNSINEMSVKSEQLVSELSKEQANRVNAITTAGQEAVSTITATSTNAVDTVNSSLQEYIDISEQIKIENGESSKLAREWAISDVMVEGIDYSAKYWADKAKDNSGIYYDEVGEETLDVDILEAGYVTTGALEETIGDISSVLDDILGEV